MPTHELTEAEVDGLRTLASLVETAAGEAGFELADELNRCQSRQERWDALYLYGIDPEAYPWRDVLTGPVDGDILADRIFNQRGFCADVGLDRLSMYVPGAEEGSDLWAACIEWLAKRFAHDALAIRDAATRQDDDGGGP